MYLSVIKENGSKMRIRDDSKLLLEDLTNDFPKSSKYLVESNQNPTLFSTKVLLVIKSRIQF